MAHIVHMLSPSDWDTFEQTGEYRPNSLSEQGFVHCSKPGQIVVVADVAHAHRDEWVLLLLDESRLESPVRYETNEDGGSAFPHVYGPLTLGAVVDSFEFVRDETGFRLPDGMLNYESR
ncbi:DUF952 domain-containing protein [Haloferax sp. MBLA0076]|uniref:DUF952 domain-containing protein n=1 Tax=Haloferax litoreum TaxID=2666140 RepID=A0A6A8GE01_9EURY|nr:MULTISPECIES: DUF952 domain-containing protein [Haloferax]KAB1192574.1 DUF952 domain-containing protein [Haloferax sp. CBA1148]MRX21046.1 DUF952 domain-containing protein [Haloferax litoreum]